MRIHLPRLLADIVLVLWLASMACTTLADDVAKQLFSRLHPAVYQVQVIDIGSGDKYSIGSGFLIDQGLLATNFHVIAAQLHEPEKLRLEVVDSESQNSVVSLAAIDVVHDLALLNLSQSDAKPLPLQLEALTKGARLYSMGNPHDLGMTIIEGNYNGLVQYVRHDNILFSGSLNPGMSGGPAFNSSGEVIGINVAKGQEHISFLVPVKHLQKLIQQHSAGEVDDFHEQIEQQLYADQQSFYQSMLDTPFMTQQLGEVELPERMSEQLNCWGHSDDDTEQAYASVHRHCRTDDQIYVKDGLFLGHFSYDYEWNSSDSLNPLQFYSATAERFSHGYFSSLDEDDASAPECETRRITLHELQWKASTCIRRYNKMTSLFDVSFILNSLEYDDRSLLLKLSMAGVSMDNALAMQRRMMESIAWSK